MKSHPFRIFTAYYYKYSKLPPTCTFHSHPQYEVYYFHNGRCELLIGDRIIPLEPGDLIIMNGMTQHCPKVDRSVEYTRTMFSFDPHLVQLLGPEMLACNPLRPFEKLRNHHIRLDADTKAECESILQRINRFYYSNDVVHHYRLLSAFYDLLLLICEQCGPELEARSSPLSDKENYVQKTIAYIEESYMEDIELGSMAAALHMNRFHLMKVFREVTGLTVFEYVYRRRVNQAKILFYQSDRHSVTEVGYKVGFKHLSHFSRVFKKLVGVTPDQYRKQIRELSRMASS